MPLSVSGIKGQTGAPVPWELHVWRGEPAFEVVCDREGVGQNDAGWRCPEADASIHLKCDKCSYKLVYKFPFKLQGSGVLEWEWMALSLPTGGDVRRKGRDDQALQVYVYFNNGTALNYIWDTNAPVGEVVERKYAILRWIRAIFFFIKFPPDVDVRHIVLRSGKAQLGVWCKERRSIVDDYIQLFGGKTPQADGVGIQINSQHTHDYAEGMIRRILLSTPNASSQAVPQRVSPVLCFDQCASPIHKSPHLQLEIVSQL